MDDETVSIPSFIICIYSSIYVANPCNLIVLENIPGFMRTNLLEAREL